MVPFAASNAAMPSTRARAEPLPLFGSLVPDPNGVLDLPNEFSYRIISRKGDEMDDGLLVPARADGMAAFDAANGTINIVCNHECLEQKDVGDYYIRRRSDC